MAQAGRGELAAAGQVLMVGVPGPQLDEAARKVLRELQVGGVILFGRNIETPLQVWELTRALQEEARQAGLPPLLISVDQEGGLVQRLKAPFTLIPPARELGQRFTPPQVRELARTTARELSLVGINLNLAPVLDVARGPRCPLWERSFGPDPEQVADFGEAVIRGHLEEGVLPVAKHFPGLGDTSLDSHAELPTAENPDARRALDLLPFQRAVKAGVPAVMTAHLQVPAWDRLPVTLSAEALSRRLRQGLSFDGLIMTDDLEMGAIACHCGVPEAGVQALAAGADLLLICNNLDAAWDTARLLTRRPDLHPRLAEAARRLRSRRERLAARPRDLDEVTHYFRDGIRKS